MVGGTSSRSMRHITKFLMMRDLLFKASTFLILDQYQTSPLYFGNALTLAQFTIYNVRLQVVII